MSPLARSTGMLAVALVKGLAQPDTPSSQIRAQVFMAWCQGEAGGEIELVASGRRLALSCVVDGHPVGSLFPRPPSRRR